MFDLGLHQRPIKVGWWAAHLTASFAFGVRSASPGLQIRKQNT